MKIRKTVAVKREKRYQIGDVHAQVDGVPNEECGGDSDDDVSGQPGAVLPDDFAGLDEHVGTERVVLQAALKNRSKSKCLT